MTGFLMLLLALLGIVCFQFAALGWSMVAIAKLRRDNIALKAKLSGHRPRTVSGSDSL